MPWLLVIEKNITIAYCFTEPCISWADFKNNAENLELHKNAEITLQRKFHHTLRIHFATDSPAWMIALNYNPLWSTDSNTLLLAAPHTHIK